MQVTSSTAYAALPNPRVTVFIPVFNAERYIADAIESVLGQTFTDFELLLIDDGSTDHTPAILSRYCSRDARIRLVTHPINRGRPRTRNHGLDLARGELIAFLDADDISTPERLAYQLAYLDEHRDIDGVGGYMAWIDEHGEPISGDLYTSPLDPDLVACQMLVDCPLANPTMMVRAAAFSNYRYNSEFNVSQDYELWARMIATCRFANFPVILTYYRHHAEQATSTQSQVQRASRLTIYSRQIAALGISHTEEDLVYHQCLFKFEGRRPVLEQTGAALDINYLRRGRAWLEVLTAANSLHQIYPQPAFSRMVAARWLFACRKAARNSSWFDVGAEFINSSLKKAVFSHWLYKLHGFFRSAQDVNEQNP